MAKALLTPEEIQKAVFNQIHRDRTVREDKAEVGVPEPTALRELDADGCNWSMTYFRNGSGYQGVIAEAVRHVRSFANLFPLEAADRLKREVEARLEKFGLVGRWTDSYSLVLRHPAERHAPVVIDLPQAFWERFEAVRDDTKADAMTNIGSAVQTIYRHDSKAAEAQKHVVDIRVLDE